MKEILDAASKNKIAIKKNATINAKNVIDTPLYSEVINLTFNVTANTTKPNSTQELKPRTVTQDETNINQINKTKQDSSVKINKFNKTEKINVTKEAKAPVTLIVTAQTKGHPETRAVEKHAIDV